jgi:arylformamidase
MIRQYPEGNIMKLPRRQFMHLATGAAASGAITASSRALTQPAPGARVKGPLVWLDMDQKELDDAYDQGVYAPNMQQVLKRSYRNSELARERLGLPRRMAYGPTPMEGLVLLSQKAAADPN